MPLAFNVVYFQEESKKSEQAGSLVPFHGAEDRPCLAQLPFYFKGKILGKQASVCCRSLSGAHASLPACCPLSQSLSYVIHYLTSRELPTPC